MTTVEQAVVWGTAIITVVLTLAGMVSHETGRLRAERHLRERIDHTSRAIVEQKAKIDSWTSGLALDYCAGHDGLALRKEMHWTPEGTWRCRECSPTVPDADLSSEIAAAGTALQLRSSSARLQDTLYALSKAAHDDPDSMMATLPIIAPISQNYLDANAVAIAVGTMPDGAEWSLWPTARAAKLYAKQLNGEVAIHLDGKHYRVEHRRTVEQSWADPTTYESI